MIKAVFWQNPQKHIIKFSINGHAGFAEAGSDIVCAAVSAVVISTINGITEIVGAPVNCSIDENTMLCQLEAETLANYNEHTQLLLKTMNLGLSELQKEYPDCLKLKTITLSFVGGEDNA